MRIAVIGDPHGNLKKIKKIPLKSVDLILLTGDLGRADLARSRFLENVERERKGLEKLKENKDYARAVYMEIHNSTVDILGYLSRKAPVYTIQGNVRIFTDSDAKKRNKKWRVKLPSTSEAIKKMGNVYLIKNRLRVFEDVRIGFLEYFLDTNWVRDFKPSDYAGRMRKAKKQSDKARRVLNRFGKGLDILIHHQPPFGLLDKVGSSAPKHWKGKHAGSKVILDYIKRNQPGYAFSCHIHEGEGHRRLGKTKVYNLGVCGYRIVEK